MGIQSPDTPESTQPAGTAHPTRSLALAQRYTKRLALSHYENFVVGGLLTPRALRQDFYNVYAYCRTADDLADELDNPQESLRRLEQWERWLLDCYDHDRPASTPSRSPHPIFVALRETIRRHHIPAAPFRQLLVAFRQDQHVTSYESFETLREYCRSSADPVGHLVLHLADAFTPERAALADNVCTGLQLANFCQDVQRDAMLGRIYIPLDELQQFDIPATTETLACRTPPARGPELLATQVDRAEQYLTSGLPLADDPQLPAWLARDVRMFALGGLAILKAIRQRRHDVWTARPVVRRSRQMRLLLSVWLGLGKKR